MTANNSSHSYVTGSAPNDYEKPELYNVRWEPDLGEIENTVIKNEQ